MWGGRRGLVGRICGGEVWMCFLGGSFFFRSIFLFGYPSIFWDMWSVRYMGWILDIGDVRCDTW